MGSPRIIIFTTPSCPWCRKTKQYLRDRGFSFKEVNVLQYKSAVNDIQRMTGQTGVPVVVINNRPVVGFNRAKIDRLLGIKQ